MTTSQSVDPTSNRIETHSPEETIEFGRRLATELRAGDVVALTGELGAGKTCLVKGIAFGLGIAQEITSPTFTIIHEYRGVLLPLYHIDLYRLDSTQEVIAVGIEEYLPGDGVTVIEWAEKIGALLPEHTKRVRMEVVGENARRIERT
jgi:tRNA threonylcarbamoyladenosine biosynthesis protein TsaE